MLWAVNMQICIISRLIKVSVSIGEKYNEKLYPNFWNVYDSIAEAFLKYNKPKQAIHYYEESLRLNPDNENALKMLKKIRK